jgi:hypothetical protein
LHNTVVDKSDETTMVNGRSSEEQQKNSRHASQLSSADVPPPGPTSEGRQPDANVIDSSSSEVGGGSDGKAQSTEIKSLTDSDDVVRSPTDKSIISGRLPADGPGGQPMFLPVSFGAEDEDKGDEFDPQKFLIFIGGFKDRCKVTLVRIPY